MASTILMPLFSVFLFLKAKLNWFIKLFLVYFIISAFSEIILEAFLIYKLNNHIIMNWYLIIQFLLLGIALFKYGEINFTSKIVNGIFWVIAFLLILRLLFFVPYSEFDSVSSSIESFLLFALSGINLIFLSRNSTTILLKDYRFWYISSCLIYNCITIVVFSTNNIYTGHNTQLGGYTWDVNLTVNIISNILYYIGNLCLPQKKNSSLSLS